MPSEGHDPEPIAQPPPVPVRALPLEYVRSGDARRPGLVTAIGVMSIVVASLSLLANLSFGMQGLVMLWMSAQGGVLAAAQQAQATAAQAQARARAATIEDGSVQQGIVTNSIRGMPPPQRELVVQAFNQLRPLSEAQRMQLEALLAECGKDVFPQDEVTERLVMTNVSDHGQLMAGAYEGADYFHLGSGRIHVSEAEAGFVPADGWNPVTVSYSVSDDIMTVSRATGAPTAGGGAGTVPANFNPFAAMTSGPPLLMLLNSIASFGLAIFLLVAGIMVLRNSPRGARLHWCYVVLKIPLAIVGGLAYAWMMSQMFAGLRAPAGPGAVPAWFTLSYAVVVAAIGCAYPLGLIFALSSRTVREYYSTFTATEVPAEA